MIEQADPPSRAPRWLPEHVERLLAIDGVAGFWSFAPTALRPDEFSKSGYSVAVCYLDEDPLAVAPTIAAVLADRWDTCARPRTRVRRALRVAPTLRLRAPPPTRLNRTANLRSTVRR